MLYLKQLERIKKFTVLAVSIKQKKDIPVWYGLNNTKRRYNTMSKESAFKFKVDIIESERGWGQKLDETKGFSSYEKAVKFITDFNKDNNQETVPDWYMYARPNNFKILNPQR